MLGELISIRGL